MVSGCSMVEGGGDALWFSTVAGVSVAGARWEGVLGGT